MNCLENLFDSENFEYLMEGGKYILEELEKNGSHLDGLKLESWSPPNQDDWGSGLPIDMKLVTPNLSFVDESFGNENMAESCLFVSKDGEKVYTCSFPSARGLEENVHTSSHSSRPPTYYETVFNNTGRHTAKDEPSKFCQVPQCSEVMRGSFLPRCSPEQPINYTPDVINDHQNILPLDFNTNPFQSSLPSFQFHDQQINDPYLQTNMSEEHDSRSYSCSDTKEETRKRPCTSSQQDHLPTKISTMYYNTNNINNNNNTCFDDTKASFMHNKSRNSFNKAVNSTWADSPATFSSDTTSGISAGESGSLEKSSIPSPDQTEDLRSSIEWQPYRSKHWCKLFSLDRNEVSINVRLNVDKGFNFSHVDDSFVCQRKNHFQVTMTFTFSHQPQFIELDNKLIAIGSMYLYFYGIKSESESHIVAIEQSESDRSKHLYQPIKINLNEIRSNIPLKAVVGRLHFGETTLNNMRKRGKPNPDQRYFRLVVGLGTNLNDDNTTPEPRFTIVGNASEKIIVRASNPNQFESDPESLWVKGKTGDSICHYGNVGINTKSPTEAMTVHGNVKITGQLLEPSDVRIKTEIKELSTKEQLKNITQINMYQYRYLPSYEEYAGLKNSPHKLVDGKSSAEIPKVGVLAQQVSQILPDAVQVVGDVVLPDGNILEGFLVVNKDRIFMEGLGAVKELCKVTDKLERRMNKIELNNEELTKFNSKIAESVLSSNSSNGNNTTKTTTTTTRRSKTKSTAISLNSEIKDGALFTSDKFGQEPPRQSGQEKIIKFFKQHWKMTILAIAISLALICGIIGMAFGIRTHNESTERVTTFKPTTSTMRPTTKNVILSCPSNIQICTPCVCADEQEIDVSSEIFPSKGMACSTYEEVPPVNPTTPYSARNALQTSLSPEIEGYIPPINDTMQNLTIDPGNDAQTSPKQQYVVSTQSLISSENVASNSTNVNMVQHLVRREASLVNSNTSDYNDDGNTIIDINNPTTNLINDYNNKQDVTEPPQLPRRATPINFDFQITLPLYNATLKSSNDTATELTFILANNFTRNISIIAEIVLSPDADIALCSWKRKDFPGGKQLETPCYQRRFPNFMTSRWKLPICFYQTTSFIFLAYDKNLEGGTCHDLGVSWGQARIYKVTFTRVC